MLICRWIFNWFPIFPFARSLMAITTVQQVMIVVVMMMINITMMINNMMLMMIIITRQTTFATLESSATPCWIFARTSSRCHRCKLIDHFTDWRLAKSSQGSN